VYFIIKFHLCLIILTKICQIRLKRSYVGYVISIDEKKRSGKLDSYKREPFESIEECRNNMVTLAAENPLSSLTVVRVSSELDGLLNEYEKFFSI